MSLLLSLFSFLVRKKQKKNDQTNKRVKKKRKKKEKRMHHVVYKNQHEHTNTNLNTISVIQLEMTFDLYGMGNSIYGGGREAFQYLYKKGPSLTHRNNGKKFIDHRKKNTYFFCSKTGR